MTDWNRSWKAKLAVAGKHVGHQVREIGSLFLPDQCQLCESIIPARIGGGVCDECLRSMPQIEHACLRCGAPIPSVVGVMEKCIYCREGRWPAERIWAWGIYRDKLRDAVVQMKSPGSEPLACSLGQALGSMLKRRHDVPKYDWIVSTPKHWLKRFMQHHNSSELLAEQVATKIGAPVNHHLLRRTRATAKQGTLRKLARSENVRGAFAVRFPRCVENKSILLIDDIVTSGATVAEMVDILKASKAARVDVACLARGIGK